MREDYVMLFENKSLDDLLANIERQMSECTDLVTKVLANIENLGKLKAVVLELKAKQRILRGQQ